MKPQQSVQTIVGSDETGVGDFFSPLVAAAVFIPPQNYDLLKKLGVKDSKLLSDKQITKIYDAIKAHIKSSVRVMPQDEYNTLTKRGFNAHELKTKLHWEAIAAVVSRVETVDLVVIDGFASEANLDKYLLKLKKSFNVPTFKAGNLITEPKAESKFLAVAAASIVARQRFIELMQLQNAKWNFIFPLGATNVIASGVVFVKKHGVKNLHFVAKTSFRTTQSVLAESHA